MTKVSKEIIQKYWDEHIHDLTIANSPVGSQGFFRELAEYRYEKLNYLIEILNSPEYKEKKILEIGCGVGIDLVCLARTGAKVTGIDISPVAINLAKQYFSINQLDANLYIMDGEETIFPNNSFDIVFAHGVLQYTADDRKMISEIHRLVKPEGQAVIMLYNRYSWLNALSALTKVGLEHQDAPVFRMYSIKEVRRMLTSFKDVQIQPERFPVATRLHRGFKARLYNDILVKLFMRLPKSWVKPLGWHLMVYARKS